MAKSYTIIKKSQYAMKFYADDLSNKKFDECVDACKKNVDIKNYSSCILYDEMLQQIISKISSTRNNKASSLTPFKQQIAKALYQRVFIEEFIDKKKNKTKRVNKLNDLTASMVDRAFQDVVTLYCNQIMEKYIELSFEYRGVIDHYELYLNNTKTHKKGDLKKIVYRKKDKNGNPISPSAERLAEVLTYLTRFGCDTTMDYIKEQYDTADDSKKALYDKIIYCVDKFGFDRLMGIALRKRNRVIRKIRFKSLSIAGNSRCDEILVYNENKESSYNAFVKLSWHTREHMILPIRFSSAFYGDIKKYNNKKGNFRYILKVDTETRMVCVILSDTRERKYINANPLYNDIAGVDCNVKNNMFTVYTGKRFLKYDYDRKLMKRYCLLLKKIDKMKKINPNYIMGKSMKRKKAAMERAMLGKEREEMVKMCKELLTYGIHHVVFENITKSFARTRAKNAEFCGINYNRLMSFLHFSSLKDEFMHIALHYDICVSFVHPHYSSKQCSECGCIDDENRRCQEIFCCIKDASHTLNADENAAVNIYKRVKEAVLRNALLQPSTKTHSKGAFEPKPMKAEEIKEILLKFYEV